jgi:hypothetical protein
LGARLVALAEDEKYREHIFKVCHDGAPIRTAMHMALAVAVHGEGAKLPPERVVRYARMAHEEERRIYLKLRDDMVRMIEINDVADLLETAEMGGSAETNVVLILRAAWRAGRNPKMAGAHRELLDEWLEDAAEPALQRLFEMNEARGAI